MSELNFTPLNYTPLSSEHTNSKKFHPLNMLLLAAFGFFVIASGLFVRSSILSTQSQADEQQNQTTNEPQNTPTQTLIARSILSTYKDEPILPAHKNLLLSVHNKEQEYQSREAIIKQFYIYREITQEVYGKDVTAPMSANTISDMQNVIARLEADVIATRVAALDFAYVYAIPSSASAVLDIPKAEQDVEARIILTNYASLLEKGTYTARQIVDVANNDEKLALYRRNGLKPSVVQGYTKEHALFPEDTALNGYLFSSPVDSALKIYTIKDTSKGEALGYSLFYILKKTTNQYTTIQELLDASEINFGYE